ETQRLLNEPAPGISASPSEDNMRYSNVMILGPTQSPYEVREKPDVRATTCAKFHAEKNVELGEDYTIFSLIDGVVSVYPREVQPENPNSYRARKREYFRMRRECRKAREAGPVL
ncbi:hypothetical protein S245_000726, partial [Arachis hypogaea]